MAIYNGDSYTDLKNLNLRGGASGGGLIRWDPATYGSNNGLWSSNPFGSSDYGLYINSAGQLVYSSGYTGSSVTTILGAAGAGGGGATTWDAIYQNDQTLAISGSTLTFDGTHATNAVVTITDSAAGSGNLLQITNTGSGYDINGTSSTWNFSKLGAMTALTAVFAGSAGATSFTLTLGNMVLSAGGIAITKAADNATFSLTNASVATAVASTWTLNGLTTGGGLLITSSGTIATTGYLLTLTGNSATNAAGLFRLNANALTSGIGFVLTSSSNVITGAGRLVYINHTGTATSAGGGTLNEFASAAADGTVIFKITASGILTGTALYVLASAMTTGVGVSVSTAGVTTGQSVSITSSSTGLTTTGRLLYVYHSGATSTTGTVAEFKTDATDAANPTTLLKLTMAASIVGVGLNIVSTTAMTTGSLIRATTATAAAVATNGIYSFLLTGAFTSTAATLGAFHVAGATTVSGTIMSILGGAQTTGVGLYISDPGVVMTSGSLLRVVTATTGALATNGIVAIQASGAYTSTSSVDGGLLDVRASGTLAGNIVNLVGAALTTGIALSISNATSGMTTGSLIRVAASGTGTVATNGIVSIKHAGIFDSTANVGLLDVGATASVSGTIVHIWNSAAQTTGQLLNVTQTGTAAGYTGNVVQITGSSTTGQANTLAVIGIHTTVGNVVSITNASASQTGAILLNVTQSGTTTGFTGSVIKAVGSFSGAGGGNVIGVTAVNTTVGDGILVTNNAITTGGSTLVNLSHSVASAIGNGSSMLRITSAGVDTGTTTGNLLDLASSASTAGVLVLLTSATLATGTGVSLALAGITTGTGLLISATAATVTGAGRYFACYDGAQQVFSIGPDGHIHSNQTTAPTIATNSTGVTAVTITAGSSDTAGQINCTVGTPANGTVVTVTFNKSYGSSPKAVILTPANSGAGLSNQMPYVTVVSATQFTLTWATGGTFGATPSYFYQVIA